MRRTTFACLALVMTFGAGTAGAQTVWRCGNAYSQQPCADGTPLEAADARTREQAQQASDAAKRDAKVADTMAADRAKEDSRHSREGGNPGLPQGRKEALGPRLRGDDGVRIKPTAKKKAKKPEHFTATVPGTVKPKTKKNKKGSA
ncbi:hypothetical protein [Ramlibacter sp.]|uniref:hypothetical protein n=1 Tax=Ramlibacter sp. TaxID=1917967 RepID=UPI003D148E4B